MSLRTVHLRAAALMLALPVLAACGGGGGGGGTVTCTSTAGGSVIVSGRITYDRVPHDSNSGLDYGAAFQEPARGITVQALNSRGDTEFARAVTDGNGNYSLTVPAGTRMFVRARAEMLRTSGAPAWNFRVFDNTSSGNPLYVLDGSDFCSESANQTRNLRARSGFTSSGGNDSERSAAPFAILDSVYRAFNKVLEADADAVFPALEIGWSPSNFPAEGGTGPGVCASNGNIGTSFYDDSTICVLGANDTDTDEYDDHVLIHEWAHYFEDRFSRSDSFGGPHATDDFLDLRVAFSEGFGNAWAGIVTGAPVYRDAVGTNQSTGFDFDVDDNNNPNPGWFSEGSVQSIVYDLYDTPNDDADAIVLGLGPIYNVLVGPQRTGVPMTSIFSFITALKVANPGSATTINALVNAQSINGSGINAYGSSETNSAGDFDVLPLYSTLTVNGAAVNRCSTDSFGLFNALGNRQLFRFSVSSSGTHTIRASGLAADPVIVLHQAGVHSDEQDQGILGDPEALSLGLTVGDYVAEVWDYRNVSSGGGSPGRYCMNVSVTRP